MVTLQEQIYEAQLALNAEQRKSESYKVLSDRHAKVADVKEQRRQQTAQDEQSTRSFLKSTTHGH